MSTRQVPTPLAPAAGEETSSLLVSVVIPCLNEAENIERCVLSARKALGEIDGEGEVIVVDNRSEDDSAKLAARAGARVVSEWRRGYGRAYLAVDLAERLAGREHAALDVLGLVQAWDHDGDKQ
jgi:glycosyltransferase involved in cell wall biosynthesis